MTESVERRKNDMISALWANSNYDDDRGSRQKAIEEIEENFQEAILKIHGIETEEEIDDSNPFFAQMKKGIAKIQQPHNPHATVATAVEDYNIDQ